MGDRSGSLHPCIPDLRGKRVLVTGGSRGIGHAVAEAFRQQGCHVAVNSRTIAPADRPDRPGPEAGPDAKAETGGDCIHLRADLSVSGVGSQLIEAAVKRLGGLDVLVCNAGRMGRRTPSGQLTRAHYDEVMDLNARAAVEICSAAIPHLTATRGTIITTSSRAARAGATGAGTALYAASKGFLATFTRSLARELAGDGVRVNSVAPGLIETDFHDVTPEQAAAVVRTTPLGRMGTAQDCVGAYLFLASPMLSGYITGQSIEVNGGSLMP